MFLACPLARRVSVLFLILSITVTGFSSVNYSLQKRSKVLPKSSSRAGAAVEQADKLADGNKWPEAIDAYKLAVRLDPNYAAAYSGLGDAYLNNGKLEEALAAYKEAVRVAPNDPQTQYNLGYCYNMMGRHSEAFVPLVKATSLDPNFAEAFYGMGYAYQHGADFEKSTGFFKSAIRLKPDYADAYYGLGQVYARQGKADAANDQYKKLLSLDPKLASKLQKEIGTVDSTANLPAQTTTHVTAAVEKSSRPAEPPATVPQVTPTQTQTPTTQSKEPVSRQLEQKPVEQITTPVTQATNATTSALQNQVSSLPVKSKRWALVIGVDKYTDPQISALKGSDNDAKLIADALVRYAGFPQDQVILLSTDQPTERQPTRVNILRRLSNLNTAVPKDGLLLVSFAGHGMERGGQAFLLPSDAQISDQISFLEETAISVNRVKERIRETGVSQVVVLLDACRNDPGGRADAANPLSSAYTNAFNFDVRNREVQAFATVYATGIGQRAYEYTEKKQGYFSWAVVEGLKGGAANDKGEVTLSQLVRYVQDTVPKRIAIDLGSSKQQRPFAVIEGFRADELVVAVTSGASMATSTTPTVAAVDPTAIELAYWDTIKNSSNPDDFKAYLDKYPDGQFAALAKSRAQPTKPAASADGNSLEITYWNAIKDSKNPNDFRAYTKKFPTGLFVELANSRIAMLEGEARERENARAAADTEFRARNTHIFDVKNGNGVDGSLTVTPGTLSFEVKKRSDKNEKNNMTIPCSEIKRVEAGQSAFQIPHVNVMLNNPGGKEKQVMFFTQSGGQGFLVNKPIVNITADVINAIIQACRMTVINK